MFEVGTKVRIRKNFYDELGNESGITYEGKTGIIVKESKNTFNVPVFDVEISDIRMRFNIYELEEIRNEVR